MKIIDYESYLLKLKEQWHPCNRISIDNISLFSYKKFWWKCFKAAEVRNRTKINSTNCPYCKKSKGENTIKKYLEYHNFNFYQEYRINTCRNKLPLPFDFAVFVDNEIKLIEYQGEHHYYDIFKDHKKIVNNDEIKKRWCLENDIKLLCIPYTQFNNINNILDSFMNIGTKK